LKLLLIVYYQVITIKAAKRAQSTAYYCANLPIKAGTCNFY